MVTVVIARGWNRDYRIHDHEEFRKEILDTIRLCDGWARSDGKEAGYTTDGGTTHLSGASLSHVAARIRELRRFRFPGAYGDQRGVLEALGFKIVRARGYRLYHGGKLGLGSECDCVTDAPERYCPVPLLPTASSPTGSQRSARSRPVLASRRKLRRGVGSY